MQELKRMTKRLPGVENFAVLTDELDGKLYLEQVVDLLACRLAEYEDLGFTPEEIKKLEESYKALKKQAIPLLMARKEGKLLVTPAVGQILYEADPEHGVVEHTVTETHWFINTNAVAGDGCTWADQWTEDDIGDSFDNDADAMRKLEENEK